MNQDENSGQDASLSRSRFDRQLAVLGVNGGNEVSPADLAAEKRLIDAATPKPLEFPSTATEPMPGRNAMRWMGIGGVFALAAAAIFLVMKAEPRTDAPPGWMMKGGTSARVFVEEGGAVKEWSAARPLDAGARVKVEVAVQEASTAFWGVVGRGPKLLSDVAWIGQNRLTLPAGGKGSFAGSLELDGKSEGENLVVVVCPASILAGKADGEATVAIGALMTSVVANQEGAGPMAGCWWRAYPLRP